MDETHLEEIKSALIDAGITGPHKSHSRRNVLMKVTTLADGESEDTFGLTGADGYSASEILSFVSTLTGCDGDITNTAGHDVMSPDKTIEGLMAAGQRLAREARRGARLVAATGHPTGMLEPYIAIVEAYRAAGGKVVRLREGESLGFGRDHSEIRYVGSVGCLADWGALRHTHSARPMEALLSGATRPDIVLGDHGFAGVALEQGIPAVAIMDINDPALAVAWADRKDVVVVPLDDNRIPASYEPAYGIVTSLIEDGSES